MHKTRRRWQPARLAIAIMLAAWAGGSWAAVRADGWAAAFPNWTLRPVLALIPPRDEDNSPSTQDLMRWDRLVMAYHGARRLREAISHDTPPVDLLSSRRNNDPAFDFVYFTGREAALARDELLALARMTDPRWQWTAANATNALIASGVDDRDVRKCLREIAVSSEMASQREAALETLLALVDTDPRAVDLLVDLLDAPEPSTVRQAALGLTSAGAAAARALPALRKAQFDAINPEVRADIQFAIKAIEAQPGS